MAASASRTSGRLRRYAGVFGLDMRLKNGLAVVAVILLAIAIVMLMRTKAANEATKQALERHDKKVVEIEKTVQRKVKQVEEVKQEAAALSPDAIAGAVRDELRLFLEQRGRDSF